MHFWNNIKSKLSAYVADNSLDCLLTVLGWYTPLAGCDIGGHLGRYSGVWMTGRCLFGFVIISYAYVVAGAVYSRHYADGLEELMKGICCSFTGIFLLNKVVWFIRQRERITNLVQLICINDKMLSKKDRSERLSVHMRMTKRHVAVYCGLLLMCVISRTSKPLRSEQSLPDKFSISICAGLEPTDIVPNKYICLFILQLELCSSLFTACSYESIFMIFIEHTAALIELLAEDFEHLQKQVEMWTRVSKIKYRNNKAMYNVETVHNTSHKKNISSMTHRHARLIKTIQELQQAYSLTVGFDLCVGIIILSIAVILYPVAADALADLVFLILLESFMYCFLGQRITDAATKLEAAVYSCGWQYLDISDQKSVFINLVASQRPVYLLAADIIPLNKETFGKILTNVYKIAATFKK